MYPETMVVEETDAQQQLFVTRVFGWMFAALVVTAGVALYVATNQSLAESILGNQGVFIGLIIGEILLVIFLSAAINRMSAGTATVVFFIYAALSGLTLSIVFLAFTAQSLASTFFVTSGTFGAMFIYGYATRRDLTNLGSLCFMGLVGIILASLANFFLASEGIYWAVTYIGIAVFIGLTAYDAQKIKEIGSQVEDGTSVARKAAIIGALALYLDFINLFLLLLRLLGRRR